MLDVFTMSGIGIVLISQQLTKQFSLGLIGKDKADNNNYEETPIQIFLSDTGLRLYS